MPSTAAWWPMRDPRRSPDEALANRLTLEALQVDNARAKGWSWQDIAGRLGVTKQAVHQKHGPRSRPGPGRQP
jgi:hypothetical protein